MSAKVDQAAMVDSSSTSLVVSSKLPVVKRKAGFVIPKNKFSGSLVPIFKGGKKAESGDAVSEESIKQVQRKTKWGPDLTQDTAVKRGRALAYQTRVDQITERLKLGTLSGDGQSSGAVVDSEVSTALNDYEKLQALDFERREAIGEILKLHPGYKAPSDYQPVMREATVCVPVKEHPGCNYVGLVYGPDGDTHKRLEMETGSKIQVFGRKSETKEKIQVEITASDSNEVLSSYDEVYIQILAESYEKVDAAAALIELLLSSVPGKSNAANASTSVSTDNAQVLSDAHDMAPVSAVSSAMTGQEFAQPAMGPVSTSSQGSFPPYSGPWFPTSQPSMRPGQAPFHSSMSFTFNPSPMHPVVGPPRPGAPYIGPSRLNPPLQGTQGPFVPPAFQLGQAGPPRSHSAGTSPFLGHLPTVGSPRGPVPQFSERPLTPTSSSPGWAVPSVGGPQSLAAGTLAPPISSVRARPSAPSITPHAFPSQVAHSSAPSFVSSQIRSSSAIPAQSFAPQSQTPLLNSSMNTVLRPAQSPMLYAPLSAMPNPALGASNAPSFTPLKPMGGAAPRPPRQGSNDFTFQPHRPQGPPQSAPGPGVHFTSQRPPPGQLPLQAASFRPTLQNVIPQHARPNFSRPQLGNQIQMGPPPVQFGSLNPNPNIGSRNLHPAPPIPNAAGSFPPRGHLGQFQQSYSTPVARPGGFIAAANRHSSPSGRPQVYDPFSPTAVSDQGSNISVTKKQESDPEYEDLMASVGVK